MQEPEAPANSGGQAPGRPIILVSAPVQASPATTNLRFQVQLAEGLVSSPQTGRLFVIFGRPGQADPRRTAGQTGDNATPMIATDVNDLAPGQSATVDATAAAFPIASLAALRPGRYSVQAVLEVNRDLKGLNMPGNLVSDAATVEINPAQGGTIRLTLNRQLPEDAPPPDNGLIRYIKLPSKLLSDFHGRPMFLRAGLLLPRDFDQEPARKYPLRVHIGGFGERYTNVRYRMIPGSRFERLWMADDTPRMLLLHLDGAGPLGDPYQVNSANHGPYGDAVTQELIPYVEQNFRGLGSPNARFLDGGSTGGWVSTALQVFYPDFFNGAWSFCPDSLDFRSFQLVNIYEDQNAYLQADGSERPACRNVDGSLDYTMRHECTMENVLGAGNSWTMSGGQWGSWNATYGARGADGKPVPLWDPKTGRINPEAAEHWKRYDIRRILEANWPTLGPRLRGKLHIWVGEADNYFLEDAVHRLDEFLQRANPPFEGSIAYGPGEGHCWIGISEEEMMRQMAQRLKSN